MFNNRKEHKDNKTTRIHAKRTRKAIEKITNKQKIRIKQPKNMQKIE